MFKGTSVLSPLQMLDSPSKLASGKSNRVSSTSPIIVPAHS